MHTQRFGITAIGNNACVTAITQESTGEQLAEILLTRGTITQEQRDWAIEMRERAHCSCRGLRRPVRRQRQLADAPMSGTMKQVIDRATVSRWLAGYETAWRTPGTGGLTDLFTSDAVYLQSPYERPVTGLDAIKRMWEEERKGPDEVFVLTTEIIAVDGPTAVVRAKVRYGDPPVQDYRDLWIIRLADDGHCTWFEEWPYWPGRPYSARDDVE
jgi:SnoaL-like domain